VDGFIPREAMKFLNVDTIVISEVNAFILNNMSGWWNGIHVGLKHLCQWLEGSNPSPDT
jgi:hypothetical protein